MRVLITNSLVLAAISLAPSASAAPYTTSSVEAYESYPNSTALAQESGPSSVPSMLHPYGRTLNLSHLTSPLDVRRDEVIHVQSLYDGSPFGDVFGPVAHFFDTIGMNTISNTIPLTDAQQAVLDQLHNALNGAADSVIARLPANHPLSPLSSRSLEDRQIPNPFSTLGSLPGLGNSPIPGLSNLLSSIGIGVNPTAAPLTDLQKQVVAKLQTAISNAVEDVAANVPRFSVLPLSHQARSVEERSLGAIVSTISQVPALSSALWPVTDLIGSLGILDGTPLDDVQKEALSKLQAAIAEAVKNIQTRAQTVHIEHTRGEHGHWDHHDHQNDPHRDDHRSHDNHRDPHSDDHHSHDEHKDRDKSWDEHKESGKSWDEHKDQNRPRDAHKPHDVHRDDHRPHHVHKDDHDVQNAHREGDRCRGPRDGQWDDCKHHKDGKERDEDPSLLKISL